VYVTHDQVEAMALADRIAVMDRGVLQQAGSPCEVYERPRNRFVAGFIGSPPMNFVEGGWRSEGDKQTFHRGDWSVELAPSSVGLACSPAGKVILGVRAEDVRLGPPMAGATPAVVTLVEPLGDVTVVSLTVNTDQSVDPGKTANASGVKAGFDLRCKTTPGVEWRVGQQVGFELDLRRLHFFDGQSGERL
jgi:multiple sugar transport system ATP-binding protein